MALKTNTTFISIGQKLRYHSYHHVLFGAFIVCDFHLTRQLVTLNGAILLIPNQRLRVSLYIVELKDDTSMEIVLTKLDPAEATKAIHKLAMDTRFCG